MLLIGGVGWRASASLTCFAKPSAWLAITPSRMSWQVLGIGKPRRHVVLQPWRCFAQAASRQPLSQNAHEKRAKAAASGSLKRL
ncbi:hypothetical protein E4U55_000415, partial [Claviceps digitariae]